MMRTRASRGEGDIVRKAERLCIGAKVVTVLGFEALSGTR